MTRAVFLLAVLTMTTASSAQEPPARTDGWAVLPVEEYRALRAKAYPAEPEPSPPPVEATLTRVEYDLKVAGDMAAGEVRVVVDVFKDGWVRVPIPEGLYVREARLDGRPVSLVEEPGGKAKTAPYVLLSKTGRSVLSLEAAVPVTSTAGTETLTLPASASALSRATLSLPRQGVDLVVAGGFLAERTDVGEGMRFVAHGRPQEPLAVTWRRKREDKRVTLPLRFRGSVTEIVGLGEDSAQVSATVRLEVIQGAASSLTVTLPEGFVVNEVSGASVADWEQSGTQATVRLLDAVEREAAFVVAGEVRTARDGVLGIPLLRLGGAERETGGVAVEVLGAGEIKDAQAKALEAGDPADLGDPVAGRDSPSLVAYRFRPQEGNAPRSLQVAVSRYTPQAVLVAAVEEARYDVLAGEEGKILVRARYAVRNNAKNFLGLALPEGATLWSAAVGGRPVRPGRSGEGGLLLPLAKAKAGQEARSFSVEVVYLDRAPAWRGKGRAKLVLPTSDLPVNRTGLALRHSPRYRVAALPGAFRLQSFEMPASPVLSADDAEMADEPKKAGPKADSADKAGLQSLVDLFQAGRGRTVAGTLPVRVPFPAFGQNLYLASELTAEGKAAVVELDYERTAK